MLIQNPCMLFVAQKNPEKAWFALPRRCWRRRLFFAMVWFLACGGLAVAEGSEEQLRGLITAAGGLPTGGDELAERAGRVADGLAGHPLQSVARSIRGLALLHAGEGSTARAQLEALASGRDDDAGVHSARVVLSLMDKDELIAALRAYYGRHMRYPDSLERLRDEFPERTLSMRDRWGDRWRYVLEEPRFFNVGSGQKFALSSRHIRGLESLAAALAKPYGSGLAEVGVSRVIQPGGGAGSIVAFRDGKSGQSFTLSEGAWDESWWFLGWVGDWIYLSDGLHFHAVSAPR